MDLQGYDIIDSDEKFDSKDSEASSSDSPSLSWPSNPPNSPVSPQTAPTPTPIYPGTIYPAGRGVNIEEYVSQYDVPIVSHFDVLAVLANYMWQEISSCLTICLRPFEDERTVNPHED
jgi:hypothetical protein